METCSHLEPAQSCPVSSGLVLSASLNSIFYFGKPERSYTYTHTHTVSTPFAGLFSELSEMLQIKSPKTKDKKQQKKVQSPCLPVSVEAVHLHTSHWEPRESLFIIPLREGSAGVVQVVGWRTIPRNTLHRG